MPFYDPSRPPKRRRAGSSVPCETGMRSQAIRPIHCLGSGRLSTVRARPRSRALRQVTPRTLSAEPLRAANGGCAPGSRTDLISAVADADVRPHSTRREYLAHIPSDLPHLPRSRLPGVGHLPSCDVSHFRVRPFVQRPTAASTRNAHLRCTAHDDCLY